MLPTEGRFSTDELGSRVVGGFVPLRHVLAAGAVLIILLMFVVDAGRSILGEGACSEFPNVTIANYESYRGVIRDVVDPDHDGMLCIVVSDD